MSLYSVEQVFCNVVFGLSYGYNPCCIRHFHVRQFNGEIFNPPANRPLTGTGFMCCPECSKKSESQLISEINEKRLIPSTFNSSGSDNFDIPELMDLVDENKVDTLISEVVSDLSPYITLER